MAKKINDKDKKELALAEKKIAADKKLEESDKKCLIDKMNEEWSEFTKTFS